VTNVLSVVCFPPHAVATLKRDMRVLTPGSVAPKCVYVENLVQISLRLQR
jgi:hypothetical protein